MTETKWSPAPWIHWKTQKDPPAHIADGDMILSAELETGTRHVVAIIARHAGESPEQLNANRDLIAAVPELYEALAEVLDEYDSSVAVPFKARLKMWNRVRSALAKARGESQ